MMPGQKHQGTHKQFYLPVRSEQGSTVQGGQLIQTDQPAAIMKTGIMLSHYHDYRQAQISLMYAC